MFRLTHISERTALALALAACLAFGALNTAALEEDDSDARAWFDLRSRVFLGGVDVDIAESREFLPGESLRLFCVFTTEDLVQGADFHVALTGPDGETITDERQKVSVQRGSSDYMLEWAWDMVPFGVSTIDIEFSQGLDATNSLLTVSLRKYERSDLDSLVAEAETVSARLAEGVDRAFGSASPLNYPLARAEVAAHGAQTARAALESDRWRHAQESAEWTAGIAREVTALMTFSGAAPELLEPVPRPEPGLVSPSEGAFRQNSRRVYLAGPVVKGTNPEAVTQAARFGLNAVMPGLTPDDIMGRAEAVAARDFSEMRRRADEMGVALLPRIELHTLGDWGLDRWPQIQRGYYGTFTYDIDDPESWEAIGECLDAFARVTRPDGPLAAVCVLENPEIMLHGREIRDRFIRHVRSLYPDRHTLNRIWRTRLATYEDIDIDVAHVSPAYRADWQAFHEGLAFDHARRFRDELAARFPAQPVMSQLGPDLFVPRRKLPGVDPEKWTVLFDVNGCQADTSLTGSRYAMEFPGPAFIYTLLRSFSPAGPLVNGGHAFLAPGDQVDGRVHDFVRSVVWEGAMNGLDALFVDSWQTAARDGAIDLARDVEALDGFAMARLELERLAPVMDAFRDAPADVAILWSDSSRVYDGGEPFIESARRAFEGCSFFGRKVRFISERQCATGELASVQVLVIPHTPSITDAAYAAIAAYVERDGIVVRVGMPFIYDERGQSRQTVIGSGRNTVIVHGRDTANQYLHGMDAADYMGSLSPIARPVTAQGYPIEGLRSAHATHHGDEYLYLLNLRDESVIAHVHGGARTGRDLLSGRDLSFPTVIAPLTPMLVRLDP